jgi:hypothetical protein
LEIANGLSAQSGNSAIITPTRRFPPPWTIEEHNNACFIVKDASGQALAYFIGLALLLRCPAR